MSNYISYIIVDDEPSSHKVLKILLKDYPIFKFVESFYDPTVALEFVKNNENACDLVFLDLNMPRLSGFDLMKKLDNPPIVVVITAYDNEYALEGYKYYDQGMIDFLNKPIEIMRLDQCVKRCMRRFDEKQKLVNLQKLISPFQRKSITVTRNKLGISHVEIDSIRFIHKYGNEVFITTDNWEVYNKRTTIAQMKKLLPLDSFVQVNKSDIIMLRKIEYYNDEIINMGKDSAGNDVVIPVSLAYRKVLNTRMTEFLDKLKKRCKRV